MTLFLVLVLILVILNTSNGSCDDLGLTDALLLRGRRGAIITVSGREGSIFARALLTGRDVGAAGHRDAGGGLHHLAVHLGGGLGGAAGGDGDVGPLDFAAGGFDDGDEEGDLGGLVAWLVVGRGRRSGGGEGFGTFSVSAHLETVVRAAVSEAIFWVAARDLACWCYYWEGVVR